MNLTLAAERGVVGRQLAAGTMTRLVRPRSWCECSVGVRRWFVSSAVLSNGEILKKPDESISRTEPDFLETPRCPSVEFDLRRSRRRRP